MSVIDVSDKQLSSILDKIAFLQDNCKNFMNEIFCSQFSFSVAQARARLTSSVIVLQLSGNQDGNVVIDVHKTFMFLMHSKFCGTKFKTLPKLVCKLFFSFWRENSKSVFYIAR